MDKVLKADDLKKIAQRLRDQGLVGALDLMPYPTDTPEQEAVCIQTKPLFELFARGLEALAREEENHGQGITLYNRTGRYYQLQER